MTSRATARHRASLRPNTPLSALSGAVSDGVGNIGRGGVVIAMSSSLVATMGLPAQAMGSDTQTGALTLSSAPTAALRLAGLRGGQPGGHRTHETQDALHAPVSAEVSFERTAFAAAPRAPKALKTLKTLKTPKAKVRVTPTSAERRHQGAEPFGSQGGTSALALASRYLGVPYVFGGGSPGGWDCSGAMRYIFGQAGIALPRSSRAQYSATRPISASRARPGDLVFFFHGGGIYHVGLYAGGGMVYDSGRSGSVFSKRAIWTTSVAFTRVTG